MRNNDRNKLIIPKVSLINPKIILTANRKPENIMYSTPFPITLFPSLPPTSHQVDSCSVCNSIILNFFYRFIYQYCFLL